MNAGLEYYRIFYYVSKYGSFTRAAEVLGSNQPNVTRSMNALEHSLGCKLLLRTNRGVSLTPEGERLFSHVEVALEQLQSGEEELSDATGLKSGCVTIGASETALHGFLLPVLGAFHRAYPGVRLRISNHSTPQALAALRNGLVDVAVVTSPTEDTSGLHIEPLGQFEEVPVCGPSLMRLCGQKLTLADLAAYPFISLGHETASYAFAYNLFAENGVAFSPDIEVATSDQILPLVRLDLGVAFLPEAFAAPALQNFHSALKSFKHAAPGWDYDPRFSVNALTKSLPDWEGAGHSLALQARHARTARGICRGRPVQNHLHRRPARGR